MAVSIFVLVFALSVEKQVLAIRQPGGSFSYEA
jgi:hypothetical protein